MQTHHVVFTAAVPPAILSRAEAETPRRARSWLLSQAWYERRGIAWQASASPDCGSAQSLVRHDALLQLDCADTAHPPSASLSLTITVGVGPVENPIHKARRVLDLPGRETIASAPGRERGAFGHGTLRTIRGKSLIGPMESDWPVDRMLTAYSSHLGSYGQGGVGLSGWQCNGGSWIVLPLAGSDGWIWLTREEIAPAQDFRSLTIAIDQRILGVHPDQLADFPPWEHRYAGHSEISDLPDFAEEKATIARFEASASGFVLEAANGLTRWRFAMGDDLPRPIWAGSREPRRLQDGESIAGSFLLAYDCYLEV